ncbi:MAG TPA: TIM barrel protein [Anaerolineales bacterium]|nr:TIM barrel protein [Anaerolineales bacterium]
MSPISFQFGTVGSPLSTPKKPGGSVGGIMRSAELGLRGLELGWVRSVRVSEGSCAEIKAAAEEQRVAISVHAPYFINLNADDLEWPKSRRRLMDAAHFGNLAGATDIIFHPGSYFEQASEEVLPYAIDRLRGCVEELRANGNPVILRPEIMGKSAMIGSLEDVLIMSQAIEGVAPCIDFAHLHARPGDGSMNTYAEWARALEVYGKALGDRALHNLHTHISGIAYGSKGEKEHLPLKEADLDLVAIFQVLRDFGCQGRILCESPLMEEDAMLCKQSWLENSGEAE